MSIAGLWAGTINAVVGSGTLVTFEEDENVEQAVISGIAFNRDEAKITVMNVPDTPGVAFRILGPVADANIDVDMIIQNASAHGATDFSFTVHRNDYARTMQLMKSDVIPNTGAAGLRVPAPSAATAAPPKCVSHRPR